MTASFTTARQFTDETHEVSRGSRFCVIAFLAAYLAMWRLSSSLKPKHGEREAKGWLAVVVVCSALLFGGASCDRTVTPDQKTIIATAAQAARERATAFNLIKTQIKAKDTTEQPALDSLLVMHGKGLNAQAAALQTLVESIDARSKLSTRGADTIIEMQKNAQGWLDDCTALKSHLDLTDAQSAWLDAHIDALTKQAQKLKEFSDAANPPPAPVNGAGQPAAAAK